jgi:hypothetical protein
MDSNLRYLSPYCLTLNVLVSFAQFEREVTGERIRDKISASKKRECGWAAWFRSATGPRTAPCTSSRIMQQSCGPCSLHVRRAREGEDALRRLAAAHGARPGASGGAQAGRVLLGDETEIARAGCCATRISRARPSRRRLAERQDCSVTSRKVAGSSIATAFDSPRPSLERKAGITTRHGRMLARSDGQCADGTG